MFYCLFSYSSLLELQYGGRILKSLATREQAREMGISVREAEWRIDAELFLNEYPRWELGAPHQSVILHEMFLHAAEQGHKEAERLVCQGCWGSASEPNLEAEYSAMELVGHQTSHKEICNIYHSVYLLRRPPGLSPCDGQQRRRAICNILSSLTSQLHQHECPATIQEGQESYEEVLRAAHQKALETAEVLQGDLKRLNQGMRDTPQTHSGSCSRSHTWRRGRSQSRSHGRACSQSHPRCGSQSRQPRSPGWPPSGRRVTFREPEVEPNPDGGAEDYLLEPPISDVETWLEWQASQLSTPTWWLELRAIPWVKDLWKIAHKIWASFSIPEVRMRATLGQGYTVPPAPRCLNRNAFLPDDLSYQNVWQQPILLTMAYARGLQYWAEKHNPLENPDCSRVRRGHKRICHLQQLGCLPGLGGRLPRSYKPAAPSHPV